MDSLYWGIVPASLMACYLLARRWLDRRAERVGHRRARHQEAEEAYQRSIEAMRREVAGHTCTRCAEPQLVAVVVAHAELMEAARPAGASVLDAPMREAMEYLQPRNELPL